MVKFISCILILQLSLVFSQELPGLDPNEKLNQTKTNYFQPGLLKASATISPGRMFQNDANTINLSGFLEYVLDKNYSLRGDVIQFIDANFGANSMIIPEFQNRLFICVFRHIGKGNFKWYNGIQAGTTITNYKNNFTLDSKTHVAPSFGLKTGAAYYVWNYFHFFADLTYLNSTLRGSNFGSQRMDELLFSAGLGFQIQTKKQVKKYRTIDGTPSF